MLGYFIVVFLSLAVTYSPAVSTSIPSIRVFDLKSQSPEVEPNGCSCVGYNCGCCQHLEVDQIGLNDTVCINVTYLDKDYGVDFTFSVDGHVYINTSFSARNPPPLCAAIPGLKDLASICVQFYNLNASTTSFSGCMRVVAKLKYVTVEKINIGCFKIPPSSRLPVGAGSLDPRPFKTRTVPDPMKTIAFVDSLINDEAWEYRWSVIKKNVIRGPN